MIDSFSISSATQQITKRLEFTPEVADILGKYSRGLWGDGTPFE
ncbi:MAG: hypothetical protein ACOH2E_04080 [Candidatus Paracaedibacter sp.]